MKTDSEQGQGLEPQRTVYKTAVLPVITNPASMGQPIQTRNLKRHLLSRQPIAMGCFFDPNTCRAVGISTIFPACHRFSCRAACRVAPTGSRLIRSFPVVIGATHIVLVGQPFVCECVVGRAESNGLFWITPTVSPLKPSPSVPGSFAGR